MTKFSKIFYEQTKAEIEKKSESTQKKQIKKRLISIYQREVAEYQDLNDFDVCKKQLLLLLEYIYNLNPETLKIFLIYSRTVEQSLSNTSSPDNINITLKAAKKSIEASLLTIEKNHLKLTPGTFAHCIVDQCIPGAFFYIESVLEYFHQNHFSLIVTGAKKQLLLDCITQFVNQQDTKIEENYEIHYINGLYNIFAQIYGCPYQKEPLATKEFESIKIHKNCKKYIEKNFNVSNFVNTLMTFIPPPPNEVIKEQDTFSKIEDFFNILGLNIKKSEHLYFSDDNGHLHPKQNFDIYLECLIADALKKNGYIEETKFTINNIDFFDNGKSIVSYDKNKQFITLDNDRFLSLIGTENGHFDKKFIRQLDNETIYQKILSEEKKDIYFNTLLKRSTLSDEIIMSLYNYLSNDSSYVPYLIKFANYLFLNLYPLPSLMILDLCEKIPSNKKNRIFKKAVIANKENYLYALLPNINKSSYCFAAQIATERSNSALLSAIHKLVDLNTIITPFEANTLPHIAIMNGNIEILKMLYSLGANFEIKNDGGYTALHYIFRFGKVEILEWFVNTVDPTLFKKVTLDFYTLIHLAAEQEQAEIFEWINKNYPKLLSQADNDGHTIAHWAAYNNDVPMLKWIHLDTLKMPDNEDYMPILFAVQNNHVETLKWILQIIPEQLNHANQSGHTLAHFAAHHNSLGILEFILDCHPTLLARPDINGNTITHIAVENNCIKTINWIQTYHPLLLESTNDRGHTLTHIAAHKANIEIIRWVEKYRKNQFYLTDKNSHTPVEIAAKQGHLDTLLAFHEMSLNINWSEILHIQPSITKNEETLVHLAIRTRNINFLNILKIYHIDVNKPNKFGWPPIFYALHQNNECLFHILVKMGANLDARDKQGNTLAHTLYKRDISHAEEKKWINILKQYHFNFDVENNDGKTYANLYDEKKSVYDQLNINRLQKNNHILYYFDSHNRPKKIIRQKTKKQNLNIRSSI